MCLAVYISSDQKLPIKMHNHENINLFSALSSKDEPVLKHFSKPHTYYLSSYEGCGCGFILKDKDPGHLEAGRESYQKLANFLESHLSPGQVEIFSCWEGSQAEEPTDRAEISLATLKSSDFSFQENSSERHFYRITL
jgi:hypothetical protein